MSVELPALEEQLANLGEPKFRAGQIFRWLHVQQAASFSEMTNLSASLRQKLEERYTIGRLQTVRKLVSALDGTVKFLFALSDGETVETVLMRYKHGNSLCISTQVGCKMGCTFCASTIAGFIRHLTPEEMLLQIMMAEQETGEHVDSLVLMGIGEPLDNFDNTISFLNILSHPQGRNMSLRHVSVSTCGLVDKMDLLAEKKYGLTLSVSLHAVTDEQRQAIMPVARKYTLRELLDACRRYTTRTGRRISFEYALIAGVNDTKENACALAGLLKGILCHVNLIPVNEVPERRGMYKTGSARSIEMFRKELERCGVNATVRRTLGADINAACGQLRREQRFDRDDRGDQT